MEHDFHARAHTLARLRRGRIGVFDRRDSSGGITRNNYLTRVRAPHTVDLNRRSLAILHFIRHR
jgi:hypothetical protein